MWRIPSLLLTAAIIPPILTWMVEVMVGTMEVAGELTTLDTPGDITVGRGEATVLGINILRLAGQLGKGDCEFCFGSGVVTTLVTRHSLTNVFCFHLFISNCVHL
mgnify:FL=1